MEIFYAEAERRLPLHEIPGLRGCIVSGGHCFGLADPVSNIILNAIGLLHEREDPRQSPTGNRIVGRRTCGRREMVALSLAGLSAFMTAYFRYLSSIQARRYLSLASYDLPLAIKLVHHDRCRGPPRLLPDGGKIKAALRVAAIQARHPAPDILALLMTAKYPPELLSPVLTKLRGTEVLDAHDVWQIMHLLDRQWPPRRPQANMEFWCRPDDSSTCTRDNDGTLHLSTFIDEGHVARIVIVPTQDHNQSHVSYISDLTFSAAHLNPKLSMCLEAVSKAKPRLMERIRGEDLEYDASPCEHMLSLKLHLLDTIHAFYIKALAILPTNPSLLRALLVAGHCYGPMEDPVSNIIVNSIWYNISFPLAQDTEAQLPQGILDTRLMARVESRSLDGLVAIIGPCHCQHRALEVVNHYNCRLPSGFYDNDSFLRAARYAKHPQYEVFGSFMASMNSLPHKEFACLRDFLPAPGKKFDGARQLPQLIAMLTKLTLLKSASVPMEAPCSLPRALTEMSTKKSTFKKYLEYVRGELNNLLLKYCYQHPWEPNFKLELICGVKGSKFSRDPNFYHVNFLAGTYDPDELQSGQFAAL